MASKSQHIIASVVRSYFEVVGDLSSTEDDLRPLLDPDVVVVERPNTLAPQGGTKDREGVLAGFLAGKQLLETQRMDVYEVVVAGERAAVRARWAGTLRVAAGPLAAGSSLVAQIAAFLTVRSGRIVHHETFDCYESFS